MLCRGRRGIPIRLARVRGTVERGLELGGTRRQPLRVLEVGLGRDVLVATAGEQGREGAEEACRVTERPVLVQLELEQPLSQEHHHLGPRQDAHVRCEPQLECELADQAVAERVERRDRGVCIAVRDELVHPELHLLRGLIRERQREDLRGLRSAGRDEPGDPPRDDLRLARSRARDDEQRAFAMRDRSTLIGVQAVEQLVEPARRGLFDPVDGRPIDPGRDRVEPEPDRNLLERPNSSTAAADHRFWSWWRWGHARRVPIGRDSSGDTTANPRRTSAGRARRARCGSGQGQAERVGFLVG